MTDLALVRRRACPCTGLLFSPSQAHRFPPYFNHTLTQIFFRIIFNWKLETQGKALRTIASLVDEGKIQPITTQCLELTVDGLRRAHGCK
jgi:hypothetical protein